MHVIATINTRAAVAGEAASELRELIVDSDDYAAARDELATQVPDGWILLNLRVPDRL